MRDVKPVTGIRNQMQKIEYVLRNDEELLRLLHYKRNPLSKAEHEDIIGSENYWDIVTEHVIYGEKDSDLKDETLCRVYLYTGRARQVFGKPFYNKQRFFINVFVHEDFVQGLRLEQIVDRVNQLLLHNQISGFSKIMFEGGDPYQAPREHETYLLSFSFLTRGKVLC